LAIKFELFLITLIILLLVVFNRYSLNIPKENLNIKNDIKNSVNIKFESTKIERFKNFILLENINVDIIKKIDSKLVLINMFYKNRNNFIKMKAGKVKLLDKNIVVINNNFKYYDNDMELKGKNLYYNINKKIAKSDTKFILKYGNNILEGDSFLFKDSKFISQNIKSVIKVN
jgi:hypothetical protein